MFRSPLARHAAGVILGALAGASLCLSVLPLGLEWAGYGSRLALGYYLSRMILFAVLVMAAGGFAVARSRHPLLAMSVFSLSGLATGMMLAGMGLERSPRLLASAGATGWLYGLLGGLILGRILAAPPAEDRDDVKAAPAPTPEIDEPPKRPGTDGPPVDGGDGI